MNTIILRSCLALCAAGALLAGCASPAPKPDPAGDFAVASGTQDVSITFAIEGGSVDAAAPDPQHLSMAEAVGRSLQASPQIQAALARVRIAQAEAKQARLLPNPVLSVIVRFPTSGGGDPEIEAGLAADMVTLLSQRGRADAADNRLRAASAEAVSQMLDVLAEVQRTYLAAQALEAANLAAEDRLKIVDRLHDLAARRMELGEGTRLDTLALDTQKLELAAELAEQKLELHQQRLALARLIGKPSAAADWRLGEWNTPNTRLPDERQWIAATLAHRPELQAKRFELLALGADEKLTRFAPYDGADVGVEGERADADWAIGPAVSTPLPLFDTGQARRDAAQARVIEARHKLTEAQRSAVEETRRAYAAHVASAENLARVRDQLIPLAEQRHSQAEAQFAAGQTGITEVLQADDELRSARSRLIQLERRHAESLIQLQRVAGGAAVSPAMKDSQP